MHQQDWRVLVQKASSPIDVAAGRVHVDYGGQAFRWAYHHFNGTISVGGRTYAGQFGAAGAWWIGDSQSPPFHLSGTSPTGTLTGTCVIHLPPPLPLSWILECAVSIDGAPELPVVIKEVTVQTASDPVGKGFSVHEDGIYFVDPAVRPLGPPYLPESVIIDGSQAPIPGNLIGLCLAARELNGHTCLHI